jgi:hypothetical protein
MTECVQAHATYRFVIRDEEHQKPRILVSYCLTTLHIVQDSTCLLDLVVQTKDVFGLYNTYLPCNPKKCKRFRSQSPLQALSAHSYRQPYRY